MRTLPNFPIVSNSKSRLQSSTALATLLLTVALSSGGGAAFAQENLRIDTGVSTNWGEGGGSPTNWIDEANDNVRFDDGDNVTFDGAGATIRLTEDLIGRTINFNASSGSFTIVRDTDQEEVMVDDNFDLEINVLSGSATFHVDVRSEQGYDDPQDTIVRINSAAGATGELITNEDFHTDVEVYNGTLTLESNGLADADARDASTKEVLRVLGGTVNVNDNAVIVGALRIEDEDGAGGATLNNNAGGEIRELARVRDGGTLNANGGVFLDDISLNGDGAAVDINEDTDVDVDVEQGTLTVAADKTLTGIVDVDGGSVTNNGTISGTVEMDGETDPNGGTLTNAADANITGEVGLRVGTINANGGSFDAGIDAQGGRINVNATQDLQIIDDTNNGSDIRVTAGNELQGAFTNESGELSVAATASVAEEVVLNGGTVNADGGTFTGGIDLNDGRLNVNDALALDLTNDNSTDIVIRNGGTLNGTVMNTAAAATVTVNAGGDAAQLITLDAGTVTADGGTFTGGLDLNAGTFDITDDLTTVGTPAGAIENDSETEINVQLDGVANVAINNSGENAVINNLEGGVINGTVTMTDGTLNAEGGTFAAGSVVFTGGTVNIEEATTLTVDNVSSQINVNAELTSNVVNNGADAVLTNNNRIEGTVTNDGGRFEQASGSVAGLVDLDSGRIVAFGGSTFDSGLDADGGSVGIIGVLNSAIDANNTDVAIATAGELDGDVTFDATTINTATLSIRGDLEGDLQINGGTTDVTGTVSQGGGDATGTITQDGGLLRVFDGAEVDGVVEVNDGALVARGGTLSSGIDVNTGGRIIINNSATQSGDVTGTVTNQGGRVFIREAGNLIGDLDNLSGNTSLRGRVTGELNITNGTVTARDAAAVTEDTNVGAGGVFVVTAGTYTGRIRTTSGGEVETRGDMSGDIVNAGGTLDLDGTIAGFVDNESGDAVSEAAISETLNVGGGSFTQSSGSVAGLTTVDGGDLFATGGDFAGGIDATAGSVLVDGNVMVSLLENDGADLNVTAGSLLEGNVSYETGSFDLDGEIDGTLSIAGSGGSASSTATVTQETTLTSGRFDAAGGDFEGGITNEGGLFVVSGATTGDVDNNSGRFVVQSGGTLTGDVTNSDRFTQNNSLTGDVTNTGLYRANSTITGSVVNDADGEFNVATAAEVTEGVVNNNDGVVNIDGTLTADLRNNAGGVVNFDDATLEGSLTNLGDVFSDGETFITGDSVNDGTITINSGTMTFDGVFENNSPNTLEILEGATFDAEGLENGVDGRIVNAGTLLGNITNLGTIENNGGVFAGVMTNDAGGIIGLEGDSEASFAGGLVNNGLVDLTGAGNTTNVLSVGGAGLSGNGQYVLDIDLSGTAGGLGQSDYIIAEAGAPVTGNLEFSFNVIAEGGQQTEDIPILIVDPSADNNFTYSPTNVTDPGDAIIYSILRDPSTGNLVVADLLNPGVGALAGSVVLTQSLIGSVINRPSSPFVNGLAYDDEDPCGAGGWARAIGGSADANGRIDQVSATGDVSFNSEISADYYGIQVGGDYACFNGYYNGWDIATGGIAGLNQGSSSQPIFAFDPNSPTGASDALITTTNVDFTQTYAGIYGTAVRDRFAAELQYRFESTDFTANNGATGSLELSDAEFGSDSNTFSGSFSYALSVPNTELTFVPVTGFAYTQISPDSIAFEDGGVVEINDFTSEVLFIGGTLSRTKFGEDGTTALNQFVTATYYNEMADDPVSTYTSADGSNTFEVTTENLGAYTELSAGLNYVQILDVGNSLNAKQLSASARADVRVSDQLESWGLTAQVRIQF